MNQYSGGRVLLHSFRVLLAAAALVALAGAGSASAQTLPRELRLKALEAVVQVIPLKDNGDPVGFSGSGTMISPDGYILTNFHVIGEENTRKAYKQHAILFTAFADQEPEFRYLAEVVAADPTYDLAVLRITRTRDNKPLPAGTRFTAVPVGDSNALIPGDPIFFVGYPGISGATITFTTGTMSGWLGEDLTAGGKQWIKTDGKIAHGNSGGAALNDQGELIGIPTAGVSDRENDERQAYVRPVALAWAVIGPNVTNVMRPGGATTASSRPAQPSSSGTSTQAPASGTSSQAPASGSQAPRQASAPAASQGGLAWPPSKSMAAGQNWTVAVQGQAAVSFTVKGRDQDNDWEGTSSSGGQSSPVFTFADGDAFVFQLSSGASSTFCVIESAAGLKGNTLTGKALFKKSKDDPIQNLNKTCTVTLAAAGAAPAAAGVGAVGALGATPAPGPALAWPVTPSFKAGQVWTLTFLGQQPWALTLGSKDQDGDWQGSADLAGDGKADALVTYDSKANVLDMIVADDSGAIICEFSGPSSVSGGALTGRALSWDPNTKKTTDLKAACTAAPKR